MRKTLLHKSWCLITLIILSFTFAQVEVISNNVKFFTVDKLNQIYAVTKDNSIQKYDSDGKMLIAKNLKVQGDIAFIDAKNVFDILLFYKSINTIVSTDNLLTQRYILNFTESEKLSNKQVTAIARSYDNQIWAFDMISQRLMKIDIYGNLILESSALQSQSSLYQVNYIIENVPYVYLIDSTKIVRMNIYGKFIKEVDSDEKIENAYLFQDTLWFQSQNKRTFISNESTSDSVITYQNIKFEGQKQRLTTGALFLKADSLFLQRNK